MGAYLTYMTLLLIVIIYVQAVLHVSSFANPHLPNPIKFSLRTNPLPESCILEKCLSTATAGAVLLQLSTCSFRDNLICHDYLVVIKDTLRHCLHAAKAMTTVFSQSAITQNFSRTSNLDFNHVFTTI